MPRRICLPCDTVGIHGPGAVSVPGGFGGQGTVRSVTGLEIRPVLLRQRLLDDATEAVILIDQLGAAGIDSLLQGPRSIRAKVFDQHAMSRCIVDHVLGGVVLADEAITIDVARTIDMPQGFGGQGTVRSVTGLEIRPVLLRHRLLDGVAEAVILIERPDSAGVDRLLQGQRSIRAKVFNQYAMPRRIVDHMLRGVVLADEAVIVDVARAIGVTDCLARLKSRPIESELIERAIDITRCELREMTAGSVVATIDREIAVDRLPEGEIAVGKEAFDRCGDAAGANDIVLGCVLLASNRGGVDVVRAVGMVNRFACNVSGAVGCLNLERAAGGKAGLVRRKTAGADRGISKPQEFYICESIGAVTARNPVAYSNVVPDKDNVVVADIAGVYCGIDSSSAVDKVVANAAGDHITAGAAINHVVVRRCPEKPVLMIGSIEVDGTD